VLSSPLRESVREPQSLQEFALPAEVEKGTDHAIATKFVTGSEIAETVTGIAVIALALEGGPEADLGIDDGLGLAHDHVTGTDLATEVGILEEEAEGVAVAEDGEEEVVVEEEEVVVEEEEVAAEEEEVAAEEEEEVVDVVEAGEEVVVEEEDVAEAGEEAEDVEEASRRKSLLKILQQLRNQKLLKRSLLQRSQQLPSSFRTQNL